MKKTFKKILSILLALILGLSVYGTTYFADNTVGNYYVLSGGTGDGRSASNPAGTVAKAIASVNADGLKQGDTANIYIMQLSSLTNKATVDSNTKYHNITSLRDASSGEKVPTHTAHIIIQPYDSNIQTYFAESTKYGDIHPWFSMSGPTTYKDLALVSVRDSHNYAVNANGKDFTYNHINSYSSFFHLGSDGTFTQAWCPRISASMGGTYSNPITINIAGDILCSNFFLGCESAATDSIYKEDFNLTFDNPGIGKHATLTYTATLGPQNLTFEKNLNVKVRSVNDMTFEGTNNKTVTVNGGVQYMYLPSLNITTHLTDVTTFSEGTKFWTLKPISLAVMDLISYTETAGTYSVANGKNIIATNSEGAFVTSKNGVLTLPEGEWSLEEYEATEFPTYYVINGGTGKGRTRASAAGSIADVLVTISKDGYTQNDTVVITVLERSDWKAAPVDDLHNMTYIGAIDNTVAAKIIIQGDPKSASKVHLAYTKHTSSEDGRNLSIYKDVTFRNLVLVGTCRDSWMFFNGNDINFENSVEFEDAYNWAGGNFKTTSGPLMATTNYIADTTFSAQNIKINALLNNGGTLSIPSNCYHSLKYTDNLNITLDNARIGQTKPFVFSFAGYHANPFTATFEKSININIKNATSVEFKSGANSNQQQFVNVKNGINVLINSGVNHNATSLFDITSITDDTPIYIIENGTNNADLIGFTNTKGKFSVSENEVYAVNEQGTRVFPENGMLTLTQGKWSVFRYRLSTGKDYFVINGGTGDGRNELNPAPSVVAAINSINEDGHTKEDTVNVYIMQRSDYNVTPTNNKHFMTYWSENGELPSAHSARIIVQPYDPTITTNLVYVSTLGAINEVIHLNGPTTFKNLRISNVRGGQNKEIYTHGCDYTVERDVSFGSLNSGDATVQHSYGDFFITSNWYGGETYNKEINILYKIPTVAGSTIYIGNARSTAGVTTYKKDINITLDNANLGSHATISYPITFSGCNYIDKNLNIYIKNADKVHFSANSGAAVNVYGGVQVIRNSMVKSSTTVSELNCFASFSKIWDITLTTLADNTLSFTSVAGTYNVQSGVTLLATNQNGDTVTSSNGKLILPHGVWTVTKKTIVHNGDSNSDGTINVIDLVHLKKRIANQTSYYPLADANQDNTINSQDLITVKKHLIGVNVIAWENYDHNIPKAYNLSGGADMQANILKSTIMNAPDTIVSGRTTYYVAANGNYNASGTSPNSPISIDKVNSLSLRSGDAVLFKRGDVFRISTAVVPKSGVSYGAYGSGPKPQILGSLRDYADPTIWESEDGVIWRTHTVVEDAANIIFNDGDMHGLRKRTLNEVLKDGDFYYDAENDYVYLYLSQINPGYYFESIEMANSSFIFRQTGSPGGLIHDIKIENISVKYPATHAFSLNFGKNLSVQNCEIAWVGGAWFGSEGGQLGNAVEFWDIAEGNNVSNNYIHQVFDAAITFQGSNINRYKDITIENNLIEYCSMNFEFWASDSNNSDDTSGDLGAIMSNINASSNIFRFGGYNFGALQRKGKSDQAFILSWFHKATADQVTNFNITNNIFDTANCFFFYGPNFFHLLNISENSYYQQPGSDFPTDRHGSYYSEDQYTFEAAIKVHDVNPKHIEWIDKN